MEWLTRWGVPQIFRGGYVLDLEASLRMTGSGSVSGSIFEKVRRSGHILRIYSYQQILRNQTELNCDGTLSSVVGGI